MRWLHFPLRRLHRRSAFPELNGSLNEAVTFFTGDPRFAGRCQMP